MKHIRILSIFLVIMHLTSSCFLTKKLEKPEDIVKQLSDTVSLRDGSLVYALPRNIFTIKIEFERTISIPGPYAKYAEELLGLEGVVMSMEEHWSVSGVAVSSHEEADPSEFYVIESSSILKSNVLALKKEGLILDLNPESNSRSNNIPDGREVNINQFMSYDLGSDEYYLVQTDTVYKRVNVDSKFIRIPYVVEKKKKLTDDELAERAAKRLMELREGKFMILTGEANVFPQNEAAINEINRMERELTELFTGKTLKDTRTVIYNISPEIDMADNPIVILKFSEVTGPEEVTAENGIPVVMELVPEQKTKDLSLIKRVQPESSEPVLDKLFYRIPDVVNVIIRIGDETLYNSRKLIYQFGEVLQLPANYIIGK